MYRLDDELKAFLESGVAVVIGTASPAGKPHIDWGWGPRVSDDRSHVRVCLDAGRSEVTLANLASQGNIAMTVASPVSFRSIQVKGRFLRTEQATADDVAAVERHRDAFSTEAALVGDPPDVIRNLWMQEVTAIELSVEHAFDQTPGPSAGREL